MSRLRAEERRPVLPAWARSGSELVTTAGWLTRLLARVAAFHTVRTPMYALLLLWWAPRGMWRAVSGVGRWAADREAAPAVRLAIEHADIGGFLRLREQRRRRVRARLLLMLLPGLPATVLVATGVVTVPDPRIGWALIVTAVLVLGLAGRPQGGRLLSPMTTAGAAPRVSAEVVTSALSSLGIAQLRHAAGQPGVVTFPSPIMRDGPGWRATVDLPLGVTAGDILQRRERLASGLRRPMGCVWPEPAGVHAGRLVIWVGDRDLSKVPAPGHPQRRSGTADVFSAAGVPFGVDPRGRSVGVPIVFQSVLIASIPRMGKTRALRNLLVGCALDVRCEIRAFDLKGTGDLRAFGAIAHDYAAGLNDRTMEHVLHALRDLATELGRRSDIIESLPLAVCPDNRITPELAARPDLGLHPIALAIDECHNLFHHREYGKEAAALCEDIVRVGPAMGIVGMFATQRPDSDSIPRGISSNVGVRFCLRVTAQLENDLVLGTSAYANGLRATTFGPSDKGIGILVGAADDPTVVTTLDVDGPDTQRICARAHALRQQAGRLTGYAAGATATGAEQNAEPEPDRLLDDVYIAFGADTQAWSDTLARRLAAHLPERYGGWNARQLGSALRPYGITTAQVWASPDNGGPPANRRGITRDAITTALQERDQRRQDGRRQDGRPP